jgi:cytochrome P450
MSTGRYFPSPPDHVPAGRMHEFDIYRFSPGVNDPLEQWGSLLASDAPRIFYTHHNGGHWVFLDYEDVREAFRNDSLFSTYQTPIPPIEPYPVMQPQGVDPPEHKTFRSLLAPLFTPVAVEKMKAELHRRSGVLLDAFAGRGACEFGRDFASLLPTGMFLYLMGMPEDRLMEFVHLAEVFMRSNDDAERATNIQQIYTVIGEYLAWRATRLGDDLGSVLVKARDENGQPLDHQDVLNCGFLLFVAGLDTVTSTMTFIWRHLAHNHAARRALTAIIDDREKLSVAVDELLRMHAVPNIYRRVKKDMVYRGVTMKENDRVVLPVSVANRNESVFAHADTIDLQREINNHLTFGAGPHRCVGSHLAKTEVTVALQEWLRRIPDFEVPAGAEIVGHMGPTLGFNRLPLVWTPAA